MVTIESDAQYSHVNHDNFIIMLSLTLSHHEKNIHCLQFNGCTHFRYCQNGTLMNGSLLLNSDDYTLIMCTL